MLKSNMGQNWQKLLPFSFCSQLEALTLFQCMEIGYNFLLRTLTRVAHHKTNQHTEWRTLSIYLCYSLAYGKDKSPPSPDCSIYVLLISGPSSSEAVWSLDTTLIFSPLKHISEMLSCHYSYTPFHTIYETVLKLGKQYNMEAYETFQF